MFKPQVQRGMKELDRSAFTLTRSVVALRVPTKSVGLIKSDLASDVLRVHKVLNVVSDNSGQNDHKLVLLRPEITTTSLDEASDQLRALVQKNGWETLTHSVTMGYDNWTADEILKAVLPDPTQAPTAYEQIGHIAHMNLRDEYLEYKSIIGQVIIDKSPTVTMVVNKLDTIDNTFRNFNMEVLAGEPNFIAQVRENDCVFRFDYSKVYWNSRLHPEHERLIKRFKIGSSVCDVMAGVGPFAVPAAKRGSLVWANDLNPASYAALADNIGLNKMQGRVKPFNMDGRDFIRQAFADFYASTQNGPLSLAPIPKNPNANRTRPAAAKPDPPPIAVASRSFDHVVMNLPAIAIEFLDAFRGLFRRITGADDSSVNLPLIHTHCFTKSDEPEKDILQRACRAMGYPEDQYMELDAEVYFVRQVAPNKDMYCLSLNLPRSVAYANDNETSEAGLKRKQDDSSEAELVTSDPKVSKADN
ncbi:tRNA(m(1)G37)methyltransferase [Coemansia sp. IMI 209128]|nr:tRNA(m(1)G37)methyltransferase [Coemansia sp. S85]KAJ2413636.1 tRNA(m(1)G37)methyltransferase [Coemansia sp. RSA 2530]KAJ2700750.1 tRNA(m(1)G37)methyltransferase [Coemansia sp. IMI 209128]